MTPRLGRQGLPVLQNTQIAAPCTAAWGAMTGDARARTCSDCREPVFNLSGMTLAEATSLLAGNTSTLCVRYFQRHDGTILLRDCAVGVAGQQRTRRTRLGVAAMTLAASAAGAYGLAVPSGHAPAPDFTQYVEAPEPALPIARVATDETDGELLAAKRRLQAVRAELAKHPRFELGSGFMGMSRSLSFESEAEAAARQAAVIVVPADGRLIFGGK